MGVTASTFRGHSHSGVVRFKFLGEKGPVYQNRVYCREDAGVVYDALRRKYPEHEELELLVWVLQPHELTHQDGRAVAAKKLMEKPVVSVGAFVPRIRYRGARPVVQGRGKLEMFGSGEATGLSDVLEIFDRREPWQKAVGWTP